ncbi:MAG: aminoacyl-tRNA hydrolase [Bacteroidetes bacterium]|nr:aminoacyl-tRNA hydrolase [Bacteroidota bacterium]
MKFLIVGLGNIGGEYEGTRHNIGFETIDAIIKDNNLEEAIERLVIYSNYKYKGKQVYLIKPTTYMNNSGRAVKYWREKLNIPLSNILIITDDISLPLGKLRLRAKGSSSGHNGLKSIEEHLNTQTYNRLKIGIGNSFTKGKQDLYVLGKFNSQEQKEIPFIINKSVEISLSFVFNGLVNTMNKYN